MPELTSRVSGQKFFVSPLEEQLLDKISPVIGGIKLSLPLPNLTPAERLSNRLAFRNDRYLYARKCNLTNKDILSVYSPNKPFPVYDMKAWWSDDWDPLSYGKDFDFSRPFFDQLAELGNTVPRLAMINKNPTNSTYIAIGSDNKNCYLCSGATANEDCMYSLAIYHSKDVLDSYLSIKNEVAYDTLHCEECYRVFFSKDCTHCSSVYFCEDCTTCQDCFGCFGLRSKQYCWFNEQLTAETYQAKLQAFLSNLTQENIAKTIQIARELTAIFPHRALFLQNTEDCLGDYLVNCKNCEYCFDLDDAQDCVHTTRLNGHIVDSLDCCEGASGVELCFNSMSIGLNLYHAICSTFVWGCRDVSYCDHCFNVEDCFGCIGLRNHARYCILNKQYSKEEYEVLVPKIVEHMKNTGEWGGFFPNRLSPFGYNETLAATMYPMSKEQAMKSGFNWNDYEAPVPDVPSIQASDLPKTIAEVSDNILSQAIICKQTGKRFRIVKQELDFYRQNSLPLPEEHPEVRHMHRIQKRNPRVFFKRICPNDQKEFLTTYPPENKNVIYCEECYLKLVTG